MSGKNTMTLGAKLMLGFLIICFINLIYQCANSSEEKKENSSVNIQNTDEVRSFVQGKWSESLPSSVSSESMYFRLLIEGNKISIWTRMGFDDWNMNRAPDEVHTYELGEVTKQVDGIPCRYLYWDEETLLTRSISTLHVTDCCILFHGSVRPLTKGWE